MLITTWMWVSGSRKQWQQFQSEVDVAEKKSLTTRDVNGTLNSKEYCKWIAPPHIRQRVAPDPHLRDNHGISPDSVHAASSGCRYEGLQRR